MFWIAYDLWLTRDLFQLAQANNNEESGCELLTIFDLQEIYSNLQKFFDSFGRVVNCLRSLTYKRFIPTMIALILSLEVLWIAYDLWLTRDLFQLVVGLIATSKVVNCLRSLTYKRFIPTTGGYFDNGG